jgi:hypothetical protein
MRPSPFKLFLGLLYIAALRFCCSICRSRLSHSVCGSFPSEDGCNESSRARLGVTQGRPIGLSRQPGNEVVLSYRREKLVRLKKKNQDALDCLLAEGRVRPLFSSQPLEIEPDRVRLKVGGETVEFENDYVFVFAGGVPPFDLLKRMGVRFGGGSIGKGEC